MSEFLGILFLLVFVGLMIGGGYVCGASQGNQLLENCRKTNNVYECEIVAVPKEQSK
jgi:hypothetical protein